MMEVLGLIASIVSISKAIVGGVNIITEVHKAPEEIRKLNEQIEVFRCVLQAVEESARQPTDAVLITTLCRAQKIVEDLHQLIIVKLLRQSSGSGRARRRAWLKNKAKIAILRDNLKDARETLWVALSASSLAATNRLELLTKQRATATQSALGGSSGLAQSQDHDSKADRHDGQASRTGSPSRRESYMRGKLSKTSTTVKNTRRPDTSKDGKTVECYYNFQRDSPASSFELSSSFFPESYTTMDATSKLVGYMNYQLHATEYSRVNRYEMFYCKAPREWIRLAISATVTIESLYWKAVRITSYRSYMFDLPANLLIRLEAFLARHTDLEQGCLLSIYLGGQTSSKGQNEKSNLRMKLAKPQATTIERLRRITSITNHWNCPRYSEKEVIQQPLYRNIYHCNHFIGYLQSRWVIAIRFGSGSAQIDANMYVLKALHCLRGSPGISPFVGILLDSRGHISGFMMELPLQGGLPALLACSIKSGNPVGWDRREKWCKQIIQGVAKAHSQGFKIGSLAQALSGAIYIDGWDRAVVCRFKREFSYDNTRPGVIPPEYRHLALACGSMEATVQTDIYQLGLLIWMIATNQMYVSKIRFCSIAGCVTETGVECLEPHADPIQLPSPGKDCPSYIEDVISGCRAKDPDCRLPAWKLLEMFPPAEEIPATSGDSTTQALQADSPCNDSIQKAERDEKLHKGALPDCDQVVVHCDSCRKMTRDHFYHCNICFTGDYDLCPECFAQGKHCLDDGHYMRQLFYSPGKEETFYTSVNHSGHRDMIKL